MAKVAIICDTHYGSRNDSVPLMRSQQKFLDTIFFPTLDAHDIKIVLHAGDYFDRRKFTNIATARFVYEHYRAPLAQRNIQEHVIVGNHDIYYRHSTTLNSVGEFYRHDERVRVYTEPYELDVDGTGILLLPWITENNRAASEQYISTSRCAVVLGHLELSGFQMYRGMPSLGGEDPAPFERFTRVMSGHYHHPSQRPPIHHLGAPYPMVWSDYGGPRGFHVYETTTDELTFVENPYSLFARLVYDDANQPHSYVRDIIKTIRADTSPYHDAYVKIVVKHRDNPYWLEMIIDALYKVNVQDITVVDDIVVDDEGVEHETITTDINTLDLIREYVDSLTISCDKDALYQYLRQKYDDAIAVSQTAGVQ